MAFGNFRVDFSFVKGSFTKGIV